MLTGARCGLLARGLGAGIGLRLRLTFGLVCTHGWHEIRRISGHHPQTMSARDQAHGVRQIDDKTIEPLHACPRQVITRFGKGAIADNAQQIAITTEAAKEAVEGELYSR